MKHSPLFAVALALAAGATLPAQSVTLLAKDVLRIHFRIPSPPSGPPDVLWLGLGIVTVNQAHTTRTARLWDCDNLLGTAATSSFGGHVGALSLGVANSWKETGSVFNFDSPGVVANFAPLRNATITGIIDFEIATGSITLDLANVSLTMIRATSANGGSVSSPAPVVLEKVVVPKLVGPTPGTVNTTNTWQASGGNPGNVMWFGFGVSCAPFLIPCTPAVYYDVASPFVFIPVTIDPRCNAFLSFHVPSSASGVTALTQCIEIVGGACEVSNFVRYTFP